MRLAALLQLGDTVDEQPSRVELGRHVRELELDRLELADPLPELAPLECIRACRVEGGLCDPECLRGDPDAAAVERAHRDGEALPLLVQQAVTAHACALDDEVDGRRGMQPELLMLL